MNGYAVFIDEKGRTAWRAVADEDDLLTGETFATSQPSMSLADAAEELLSAVQAWLDSTAQANGYDSLASCISYRGSTVTQWDADATAALAWRDAVWQACFQWQQSAAQSSPSLIPTSDEVISQLPQPSSFGWITHLPRQPQA